MAAEEGNIPNITPGTTPPATPPKLPVEPTPSTEPPVAPTPSSTPLSEDAAAKLKEDISKDVSEKITKTVSEGVIQKIGKAFGLTKKEEEDLPKDPDALKKMVGAMIQEGFAAREEDQFRTSEETDKQRQGRIDDIVRGWHSQYESLARSGKLPPIENAQDPNDKGVVARRKIILAIGKINESNRSAGLPRYTPTVAEVLVNNPDVLSGPPGADLPISGNTQVREEPDSFTYGDTHDKSFEEIAEEA
ncbi:hypothetical protein KKE60_04890 [Patescibacteria group bacterium]|nr:hypothetical protein [Patescibacteria group bacterium]